MDHHNLPQLPSILYVILWVGWGEDSTLACGTQVCTLFKGPEFYREGKYKYEYMAYV